MNDSDFPPRVWLFHDGYASAIKPDHSNSAVEYVRIDRIGDASMDAQRMSFCLSCGFPVRNQTPRDPGKTWIHPYGLHFGETALEAIDKARSAAIAERSAKMAIPAAGE